MAETNWTSIATGHDGKLFIELACSEQTEARERKLHGLPTVYTMPAIKWIRMRTDRAEQLEEFGKRFDPNCQAIIYGLADCYSLEVYDPTFTTMINHAAIFAAIAKGFDKIS